MNVRNLLHLKIKDKKKNPFNYSEGTRFFKTNQITSLFLFFMINELKKPQQSPVAQTT